MNQLLTILTSIVLIAGKSHPPIPPCALPSLVWRCSCRATTRKPTVLRDYSTPAHKGLGMDRAEHSCYAQGLGEVICYSDHYCSYFEVIDFPQGQSQRPNNRWSSRCLQTLISAGGRVRLTERSTCFCACCLYKQSIFLLPSEVFLISF